MALQSSMCSTTEDLKKKIKKKRLFFSETRIFRDPVSRSQAKALWKDLRRPRMKLVSSSKPSGVQQIQQVGTCSNGRASQVCATALLATRQLAPHRKCNSQMQVQHFLEKPVAKIGNSITNKNKHSPDTKPSSQHKLSAANCRTDPSIWATSLTNSSS